MTLHTKTTKCLAYICTLSCSTDHGLLTLQTKLSALTSKSTNVLTSLHANASLRLSDVCTLPS
ncbi:MAG: hypothetical protein CMJ17_09985 [Phenylobacterium sp.]|nr:hypothetical protein [Phenylobacterium sp.]